LKMQGLGVAITGGAGDLGSAMAMEFARRGARVTVLDAKPSEDAEPYLNRVREHGEVDYVRVDVTDRGAVSEALGGIEPLDVAIGNAGITKSTSFLEITEEEWRAQIAINLTGCFYFGQAAARIMVDQGRTGSILFTGSWIQEIPQPRNAAYSVSKAGVRMLARSMALELGEHGIRVNVVAPGIVNAGMAKRQMESEPEFARRATAVIPLRGKLQTVEQIARAAAFLCSDDADAITGAVLLVDGGASLFKFE
jgi:NAD(P)-dependent dehydrogenase (short-subunit alcohol dehydrogenase family)